MPKLARELKEFLLGKEYHTTIEHERRVHVCFMLVHVWHDRWEVWEAFGPTRVLLHSTV